MVFFGETIMHPYQDQTDRMWEIIKLELKAKKNGFWLESLSLSYILLEARLRFLLKSKAGKDGIPLPSHKIDKQKYLMSLANLARDHEFINHEIWSKIREFNDIRKKAIHGMIHGEITYSELKEPAENVFEIAYAIQNRWLPITIGKEETIEKYKSSNPEK